MDTSNDLYKINFELEKNFSDELYRLFSFGSWFSQEVEKEKLARAGFFYTGEKDSVRCFFCEVMIGCWMRGDTPFIEHKIHSPDCPFVNEEKTSNIPIPETRHLLLEELTVLRKSDISASNRNTKLVKLSAQRIAETARHPDYANKKKRLETFVNWPTALKQTPEELSDAGFFYLGVGDEVKCFYCGGCLRNFASNDHALNEHRKIYSNRCLFIQFTYKNLKSNTYKLENRRPIKATAEQIDYLIDYMKINEGMRTGSLLQDRVAYVQTWKDLTKALNDLDGAVKDVKGWKEVWRNYKYNQKRKSKLEEIEINLNSSSSTSNYMSILTPQSESSDNAMESANIPHAVELDLMDFINLDAKNPNINLETTLATVEVTPKPDPEKPSSLAKDLSTEITQLRLKIDQYHLEIEKLQLELEMKLRQQQLAQKQQELQTKWNEIEIKKN